MWRLQGRVSSCYRVHVGESDVLDVVYSSEGVGESLVLGCVCVLHGRRAIVAVVI